MGKAEVGEKATILKIQECAKKWESVDVNMLVSTLQVQ